VLVYENKDAVEINIPVEYTYIYIVLKYQIYLYGL
jgi:hypothetical protein